MRQDSCDETCADKQDRLFRCHIVHALPLQNFTRYNECNWHGKNDRGKWSDVSVNVEQVDKYIDQQRRHRHIDHLGEREHQEFRQSRFDFIGEVHVKEKGNDHTDEKGKDVGGEVMPPDQVIKKNIKKIVIRRIQSADDDEPGEFIIPLFHSDRLLQLTSFDHEYPSSHCFLLSNSVVVFSFPYRFCPHIPRLHQGSPIAPRRGTR